MEANRSRRAWLALGTLVVAALGQLLVVTDVSATLGLALFVGAAVAGVVARVAIAVPRRRTGVRV